MKPYNLAADELAVLRSIAVEVRETTRGRIVGGCVANEVARRGGVQPHAAIRALLAMDDLRLPKDDTLTGLAVGAGIPDAAPRWIAAVTRLREERAR